MTYKEINGKLMPAHFEREESFDAVTYASLRGIKRSKMGKKIFIIAMASISLIMFLSCSYSPETYNEAEYMTGTGYDKASDWFKDFISKKTPETSQSFPLVLGGVPPPNYFIFKEPVALLLCENKIVNYYEKAPDAVFRFVKLPNVKTANTLMEAKTLIMIEYRHGEEIYSRKIDVFDINESYRITNYGWSSDFIRNKPPGLKKIIEQANENLSYLQFVNDGTDLLSKWRFYLDAIAKLDLNKTNTPFYKKINSQNKVRNLKISNYDEKDVIGNVYVNLLDNKYRVILNNNANEFPKKDTWYVVIHTVYDKEYLGYWIRVDEKGQRIGNWSEDAFKYYNNTFVVNVNSSTIVEQYSSESKN